MTSYEGSRRWRERVRWPGHSSRGGAAERSAASPPGLAEGRKRRLASAFDWPAAQRRWGIVGHKWDLGVLANLYEQDGRTPRDLRIAINSQARAKRPLLAQTLSVRLKEMEKQGLVRHEDKSEYPAVRLYFLRPPGRALAAELAGMLGTAPPDDRGKVPAAMAAALRAR